MSRDLRSQYGAGDSTDPYTQAKAWAHFINDTKGQLAHRIGREPTNDELYLAHYFGEGRAARMIGGGIAPSTNVADVFTPAELAANPNIAKAGTVGALTSGIGADMEARQAKYGGTQISPQLSGTDFASFGQANSGASPNSNGGQPPTALTYKSTSPDFASFGQPQGNSQAAANPAGPRSQPIDFAQFGTAQNEENNSQTIPSAQGAGGIESLGGMVDLTSKMAPNGIDTSGMRPSTNVEDDRNTSVLGKLANKFSSQMNGTWESPDGNGEEVDVSQFGLPDTAAALSQVAPPAAPLPQVPVTGL